MVRILQSERDSIAAACAKHGVARLEAFGSALREDFKPGESDIDLLVDFMPMDPHARVDAYFGLLTDLRELLHADVDLVMVSAVRNTYIARSIERTRQLLYAA